MLNVESIAQLRRTFSFFATRGMTHTLTYGLWRAKSLLQRTIAPSFQVDLAKEFAHSNLSAQIRSRATPFFFFDESDLPKLIEQIPTEEKERTLRAAKQICQNIFELRGVPPVRFKDSIDWLYEPNGNIDWRWDLNRHAFFETLGRAYRYSGDEQYAAKFKEIVDDWLQHNPAQFDQPNWTSVFEVAFRINVWCWALYYFRPSPLLDKEFGQRFVAGLLTHGRYLAANIELHVPNNHLLLEAKALALIGILFPEFKDARKWRERGLKIVERQVEEQVCPDGVHGERTTLYHRVIAGELLELMVLMENNRLSIPATWLERFTRMVDFEIALIKPDQTFPLLGDSAVTDTHLRFSASSSGPVFLKAEPAQPLREADLWLLGLQRVKGWEEKRMALCTFDSAAFPDGGYFLMKAGQGIAAHYLVFDCGSFGLDAMPNHGHADALSFELFAMGQTLLVDPGFYSTALGLDWRNFFRGSRSHNTVVVDGVDQSHLLDVRRVYRPARAKCLNWISNSKFDFLDGVHDGYKRLADPVRHRRQILFAKPRYWVISDVLTGQGKHRFDVYFHTMPGAKTLIDSKTKTVRIENQTGAGLLIVPYANEEWGIETQSGATNPIQGWVSFFSGEKTPAGVLDFYREGNTPMQFCTILYPYRLNEQPDIRVSPLQVEGRTANDVNLIALSIETRGRVDHLTIDRTRYEPTQVEFTSLKKG
ncbi:MAG: alginate lyase family protein [Chloroflexi bacterium]|nr:alginate lyase family protein [Chloroflexota bacterium]